MLILMQLGNCIVVCSDIFSTGWLTLGTPLEQARYLYQEFII